MVTDTVLIKMKWIQAYQALQTAVPLVSVELTLEDLATQCWSILTVYETHIWTVSIPRIKVILEESF